MQEKYLWVQKGAGDFPIGKDEDGNQLIIEYNCVFNPQKVKLLPGAPLNPLSVLEYFEYFPEGVTMEYGAGGLIMEYTDNIEIVRKEWYKLMLSHYKHLQWLGELVKLSPEWEIEMSKILIQANKHKIKYPELWI